MLHWGIAGVSKISHDFCIALNSGLTSKEHKVIAIASKSAERALNFAQTHGIPQAYGSYEELAKNPAIKVIYVAVLNPFHYEIAKLMITHQKHVVCEKPLAMNLIQASDLFSLAAKHKSFLMEGLWSRFFPVYRHLGNLIDEGKLGEVKEIYVKHGFKGLGNERIERKNLGGGILLDIGCYALQFILFVYREPPLTINAKGKVNKEGVDLHFEAELTFARGRKATIECSGLGELDNQATLITTKGPICVPSYWCPTKYIALEKLHEWPLIETADKMNFTNSVGLKYEADEVARCIEKGKLTCSLASVDDSLLIATIQDEIRRQIGVEYECDKHNLK